MNRTFRTLLLAGAALTTAHSAFAEAPPPIEGTEVEEIIVNGKFIPDVIRDTAEVATGDLVERRGERYEFSGRRSDTIVVGGAKVFPRRVEDVLRAVPGVADARAYGLPSAITGEIVAAQIVAADPLPEGVTPENLRAAALAACRAALEAHSVPRVLDFTRKLFTNPSGKVPRRPVGR